MVFQTVVLINLLIQDGCRLRQGVKIILLESDYLSTKMHQKSNSSGTGMLPYSDKISIISKYTVYSIEMNPAAKCGISILASIYIYITHINL